MEINFRRKIQQQLVNWKNDLEHKSLVVTGARQIGKTYNINKFGIENYKSLIEVNLADDVEIRSFFETNKEPLKIINYICALKNVEYIENDTLLFLDEIQESDDAYQCLKAFTKFKGIDVIASGSLMGLKYKNKKKKKHALNPVGYIDELDMKPMDFEEFLWAINKSSINVLEMIKEAYETKKQIEHSWHKLYIEFIKKYIIVGGMPLAVLKFIQTQNYGLVRKEQEMIVKGYKRDIKKYAPNNIQIRKITECFDNIFTQLAKNTKTFKFSQVYKNAKAETLLDSLQWLVDAGIISMCYCLDEPIDPFDIHKDISDFKVYMNDIGLLMSMCKQNPTRYIMEGNLGIHSGAIYEHLIACFFYQNNIPLYYFKFMDNNLKTSKVRPYEIDFILEKDDKITFVEVKATNGKTKSLSHALKKYSKLKPNAIKFISGNVGKPESFEPLPFYFAILFKDYNN